MKISPPTSHPKRLGARGGAVARAAVLAVACGLGVSFAWAQPDRSQPLNITADRGTVDGKTQLLTYQGNVVVRQGSLSIEADRIEVREARDGRRTLLAQGSSERPVRFRKKAEGKNEFFEGAADRVDFDDRSDVVRFSGNATAKRLVGNDPVDQVSGSVITYDYRKEFFSVEGQTGGTRRVQVTIQPRPEGAASAPAAGDAAKRP